METNWSEVDALLEQPTIDLSAIFVALYAMLLTLDEVLQKLRETKTTLKNLCFFSNKTEVAAFATATSTQTYDQQEDGISEAQLAAVMVGVKAPIKS
jgi:hypothetical protein